MKMIQTAQRGNPKNSRPARLGVAISAFTQAMATFAMDFLAFQKDQRTEHNFIDNQLICSTVVTRPFVKTVGLLLCSI